MGGSRAVLVRGERDGAAPEQPEPHRRREPRSRTGSPPRSSTPPSTRPSAATSWSGSAAVDLNRYKHAHSAQLDGLPRQPREFDWNTIGDLSGALGADGIPRVTATTESRRLQRRRRLVNARNLQTDNHAFAASRSAARRAGRSSPASMPISATSPTRTFRATRSGSGRPTSARATPTSPDLSFGVTGAYVARRLSARRRPDGDAVQSFNYQLGRPTTNWQASGNSRWTPASATRRKTATRCPAIATSSTVSLNWTWTPPSHFTVSRRPEAQLGRRHVVDGRQHRHRQCQQPERHVDQQRRPFRGDLRTDRQDQSGRQCRLHAAQVLGPEPEAAGAGCRTASTRTSRFFLNAHYQPTRTTDLSCGGGARDASRRREPGGADARVHRQLPAVHGVDPLRLIASELILTKNKK